MDKLQKVLDAIPGPKKEPMPTGTKPKKRRGNGKRRGAVHEGMFSSSGSEQSTSTSTRTREEMRALFDAEDLRSSAALQIRGRVAPIYTSPKFNWTTMQGKGYQAGALNDDELDSMRSEERKP